MRNGYFVSPLHKYSSHLPVPLISPEMNARTLNCYSCGAAVSSDAPNCAHCGARLASIACPSCFGMMFTGANFCPHCGSAAAGWQEGTTELVCPGCQTPMMRGQLGQTALHECGKCYGIWLNTATFERICRDSERQAAVLGAAHRVDSSTAFALGPVRYVKCPQCREMMHRVNFAQCSGVVVDTCRHHGTWFEMHELRRIVQFIHRGGLDQARRREKAALAEERRRLQSERNEERSPNLIGRFGSSPAHERNPDLLVSVVEAAGLLRIWMD